MTYEDPFTRNRFTEHCMLRNKQILLLGDAYMKKKLINRLSFTYSMFIDELQ